MSNLKVFKITILFVCIIIGNFVVGQAINYNKKHFSFGEEVWVFNMDDARVKFDENGYITRKSFQYAEKGYISGFVRRTIHSPINGARSVSPPESKHFKDKDEYNRCKKNDLFSYGDNGLILPLTEQNGDKELILYSIGIDWTKDLRVVRVIPEQNAVFYHL